MKKILFLPCLLSEKRNGEDVLHVLFTTNVSERPSSALSPGRGGGRRGGVGYSQNNWVPKSAISLPFSRPEEEYDTLFQTYFSCYTVGLNKYCLSAILP